jgi:hypothetical protein
VVWLQVYSVHVGAFTSSLSLGNTSGRRRVNIITWYDSDCQSADCSGRLVGMQQGRFVTTHLQGPCSLSAERSVTPVDMAIGGTVERCVVRARDSL